MTSYLDPSFLVSLYSSDTNFEAAVRVMQNFEGQRWVTTFGALEVMNAFGLRVFRKQVTPLQAQSSLDDFDRDLRSGVLRVHPIPEQAFERARSLSLQTTARLGTRTADLLHVAAALELGVDRLFSFDKQQRKLAQIVRLKLN